MILVSVIGYMSFHHKGHEESGPRLLIIIIFFLAPEVVIVDEHGVQLLDKYYESDSTIQLSCIVRHVAMTSSVVLWMHGTRILNYDLTRGGIR